MAKPL